MHATTKLAFCTIALGALTTSLAQQAAPLIAFSSPTYEVAENSGMATIKITRRGDLTQTIVVDYLTSDGTALAGKDYIAQHGTLSFASGVATGLIQVPILDNGAVDGARTVKVTISNATLLPTPATAT